LWREDCTEEGWQRFCEEHGINPNLTAVPMPVRTHGEQYTLLRREDFPEEEWSRFCQERGEDSEVNMVEVPFTDTRLLEGASRIPPEPLYALIGVYILGGGSLEELLAELHPYPATVDRERLEKMVRRLKIENGRIATLVRGGNPRTGRGSEGLDAYEHTTAVYIQRRRREGMPDDQIRKELSYEAPALPEAPFPPESITQEELERLGGLNLT
jgi:hypothetical protein